LALLYGPSGIGKTFVVEEFIERCEKQANSEKPEVLFVTAHAASTPKSLMAALCLQAGIPHSGTAPTLAESLVRRLETGHFLIIVDEANHLEIEAMELLRYVYDRGRGGQAGRKPVRRSRGRSRRFRAAGALLPVVGESSGLPFGFGRREGRALPYACSVAASAP